MIVMQLFIWLVAGAYAGHLFSMRSGGMGLAPNLIGGMLGACLAGVVLGAMGVTTPLGWLITAFLFAFAGAGTTLVLLRFLSRRPLGPTEV